MLLDIIFKLPDSFLNVVKLPVNIQKIINHVILEIPENIIEII